MYWNRTTVTVNVCKPFCSDISVQLRILKRLWKWEYGLDTLFSIRSPQNYRNTLKRYSNAFAKYRRIAWKSSTTKCIFEYANAVCLQNIFHCKVCV